MSVDVEDSLVSVTVVINSPQTISETIGAVYFHLRLLAILDVDGRAIRVGDGDTFQLHGALERAFQIELAIGGAAREHIDDFTRK